MVKEQTRPTRPVKKKIIEGDGGGNRCYPADEDWYGNKRSTAISSSLLKGTGTIFKGLGVAKQNRSKLIVIALCYGSNKYDYDCLRTIHKLGSLRPPYF